MHSTYTIVASIIAVTLLQGFNINIIVDGCSCRFPPPSYKKLFCQSDFVIKAKILNRTHIGPALFGDNKYSIKIKSVLRTTSEYEDAAHDAVISADNSAACGIGLALDNKFLLAGFVHKGQLRITRCHWNQPWKLISRKLRNRVKNEFRQNDACRGIPRLNLKFP